MDKSHVLAIDQSTQATKALLFDRDGALVRRATVPHRQIYPAAGLVEHDPLEILANASRAVAEVVAGAGIAWSEIACLSIANQRETVLAWDADTGLPVHNALVWQDGRGAALCAALSAEGAAALVAERTGLRLDPYFSASKLAWIVAESPAARRALKAGKLMAGTVDSWLIWNLTGRAVFATDYSNASRTMLFDIASLSWDRELLGLFGLEGIRLPEPRCSDAPFGEAALADAVSPIPIAGVMGDSHAALFGHCGWRVGDAKATYGTGSSLMANIGRTPSPPRGGLVLSLAWGFGGEPAYVFEGNVHATGYTMRWLRDGLGLFSTYDEAERLATEVEDNGGVYLVPAFSGLGAPWWEHGIRALITGLSHGSDRRRIVRAGLESIAFQIADLVGAVDAGAPTPLASLQVDGGPTRNAFLMQFQADLLGVPVAVPDVEEISALGAAYMGGVASGFWAGQAQVAALPRRTRTYEPRMEPRTRDRLLSEWRSAVAQAISRKVDE